VQSGLQRSSTGPPPPVFALRVMVRHEKVVSQLRQNKGLETFLPLYARRHQYLTRVRRFELPLFPGYLFCQSDAGSRWRFTQPQACCRSWAPEEFQSRSKTMK